MKGKLVWFSILGVLLGTVGGFFIANGLNRSEMNKLRAENAALLKKSGGGNTPNKQTSSLSEAEINEKLKEAEENPKDFAFQKGLGLALYQYAAKKQDSKLLEQVATLLNRAHQLNKDDYQVLVSLGNVNFDLGQLNKDTDRNLRSQALYQTALEKNPKDTDVLADFGLTFLFEKPSDAARAVSELDKALGQNPKHERALQFMTQAKIDSGNEKEAREYLARLKEVNPKNLGINLLESKLAQITNK